MKPFVFFLRSCCRPRLWILKSLKVEEETAINYVAGEKKQLRRYLKESLIKPLVSLKKMETDRLCYKTVYLQKLKFN